MQGVTREDRKQEDRERLEAAVRDLMTSEGWQRFIETRSKFHSYSFNNQLLIALQAPNASQVAGYKTWQKLGRQVLKGEKGIKILAPCTYRQKVETESGEEKTVGQVRGFRTVSVFDVAQTEGEPLPAAPMSPIEGDSHEGYLPALEAYAGTLGYSVRYEEQTGGRGGYCSEVGHVISVDSERAANARLRILVHEVAHAHGVDYTDYTRHESEVIVESVTAIVCGRLGLDTTGESLAYIAGWGRGDDLAAMKTFAGVVDTIATKIENALGLGKSQTSAREEVAA